MAHFHSRGAWLGVKARDLLQVVAAAAIAVAATHLLWRLGAHHPGSGVAAAVETGVLGVVAILVAALAFARLGAEATLRERQALVQAVLDEAPEAIFVKDDRGRYVLVNRAAAQLFGRPARALVGRDDDAVLPPEVADAVRATDREALEGGGTVRAEEARPTPDGRRRILSATKTAWRDASGRPAGIIGVARDVTARKRREAERTRLLALERDARAAAEAAERRFLDLVDGLDAVVWEADARTLAFTFVNRRADELVGWPMETWLEERDFWSRLLHPDDRARVLAARRRVAETGTSDDGEYRVCTAEGEVRWFRDLVHAVRDDDGRVHQLRGVMFDVTARRRVEERLRESEARFRLLADNAPVLIWMSGADKGCTWFNRQWLEFTGRTLAQEVGDGWREDVHPDDLERCVGTYVAAFDAREPFASEYRLRRHDGAWRWVLDVGTPRVDADGSFTGYLGSALDITERRAMEQELREQRELAQAANRAKDDFLATMSHELRTPLAAILGWARLLRTSTLPPAKMARALETIERAGRAQAQLIDDLLDISRITTGRLRLDARPLVLREPVEAALESLRTAAEAKHVTVVADVQPDAGTVMGDAGRLQQVVWNLLSNALKFTPEGGRVTVRLWRDGTSACLAVDDTGKGIAPEFLPHVFDRFRQADVGTTRRHGGLGLGLAIVRHLVEMHGGRVRAQSDGVGRGASFSLSLPLVEVPAVAGDDGARALGAGGDGSLEGRRVLVVDDDHDAREVLVAILEESGAQVTAASSVPEAMTALEDRGADVVVSDIAMPGEDGFDLIRRLRAGEPAARHTPAVAVTALARGEERRRILDAGFELHLAKPVEPRELVDAIANLTAAR